MNQQTLFRSCLVLAMMFVLFGGGCSLSDITGGYTEESFEKLIGQDKLILVKFGSSSCPPCVRLDKELKAIEADPPKGLKVHYLSVGSNREVAQKYNISGIPRMMLFRSGRKLGDRVGYQNKQQIRSWIGSRGGIIGDVQSNPFAMRTPQVDRPLRITLLND